MLPRAGWLRCQERARMSAERMRKCPHKSTLCAWARQNPAFSHWVSECSATATPAPHLLYQVSWILDLSQSPAHIRSVPRGRGFRTGSCQISPSRVDSVCSRLAPAVSLEKAKVWRSSSIYSCSRICCSGLPSSHAQEHSSCVLAPTAHSRKGLW